MQRAEYTGQRRLFNVVPCLLLVAELGQLTKIQTREKKSESIHYPERTEATQTQGEGLKLQHRTLVQQHYVWAEQGNLHLSRNNFKRGGCTWSRDMNALQNEVQHCCINIGGGKLCAFLSILTSTPSGENKQHLIQVWPGKQNLKRRRCQPKLQFTYSIKNNECVPVCNCVCVCVCLL